MSERVAEYSDPELSSKLPAGYKIVRIKYASGWLCNSKWEKSSGSYWNENDANRNAIEVRAKNGRVMAAVGWFDPEGDSVATIGTYVSKKLRRKGLGRALWKAMIQETNCKVIKSHVVTHNGLALVTKLKEQLKNVEIEVDVDDYLD